MSDPRQLPRGGAMGATMGIWEYLSQTNNNADCVPEEDRFKFCDDLTTLEVINLLTIGLSMYDITSHIPSDIPLDTYFVQSDKLKTQQYLTQINEWSEKQQMIISKKKTKAILFNFTVDHQFVTRLQLKNENIQLVNKIKLLGTWINDKLTWDDNCSYLIKKVNNRMQLLRNILAFGATKKEMVHLWILFCRSILEQSCVLWHNALTKENIEDLERTQKTFIKLLLKDNYTNYEDGLVQVNLISLSERRKQIILKFAKDGLENKTLCDLLKKRENLHHMNMRKTENFQVDFAHTERLKRSGVILMQSLLNEEQRTS